MEEARCLRGSFSSLFTKYLNFYSVIEKEAQSLSEYMSVEDFAAVWIFYVAREEMVFENFKNY